MIKQLAPVHGPEVTRGRTKSCKSLRWRHNGHDGVSNHQPHDYLLNRLFGHRSKKTSNLCVTGLCGGIHRGPVNSPHKWPVTRKMSPFHDVIISHILSKRVSGEWPYCIPSNGVVSKIRISTYVYALLNFQCCNPGLLMKFLFHS